MKLVYGKKLIRFILSSLLMLLFAGKSFSIEPNTFIQSTVNRASSALSDSFSKEEKIEKLKIIAKETVDIKGIGLYTLGKHRKNMNDEKKTEYLKLFEKYFLKTFSDRLSEYTNPKVRVNESQKLNENYTIALDLRAHCNTKSCKINLGWVCFSFRYATYLGPIDDWGAFGLRQPPSIDLAELGAHIQRSHVSKGEHSAILLFREDLESPFFVIWCDNTLNKVGPYSFGCVLRDRCVECDDATKCRFGVAG